MKKIPLLLLTLIWTPLALQAEAYYDLIVDENFSPHSSAEDFLTIHRGLTHAADWLIEPKEEPPIGVFPSIGRFLELGFFWDPLNYFTSIVQHEVFGHGYRARDIGSSHVIVTGYTVDAPPPYGQGQGSTQLGITAKFTLEDDISLDIAGIEAQGVLSRRLKRKWLSHQKIDPRTASLYLTNQQALLLYANHGETSIGNFNPLDDIENYVLTLNVLYPRKHMTKSKVRRNSYINLLDPFSFYSVYAWLNYIITGKQTDIPMINIKSLSFLPAAKVSLAPYGIEYGIEAFWLFDERPFYTYVKAGRYGGQTYWGIGGEHDQIFNWERGSVGLRFDLWQQPENSLADLPIRGLRFDSLCFAFQSFKTTFGAALTCIGRYKLTEHSPLFLYGEVGYKLKGYLPGDPLKASEIVRFGFAGEF